MKIFVIKINSIRIYFMKRIVAFYISKRKKAFIIIALITPLVFLLLLILNLFMPIN